MCSECNADRGHPAESCSNEKEANLESMLIRFLHLDTCIFRNIQDNFILEKNRLKSSNRVAEKTFLMLFHVSKLVKCRSDSVLKILYQSQTLVMHRLDLQPKVFERDKYKTTILLESTLTHAEFLKLLLTQILRTTNRENIKYRKYKVSVLWML